MSSKMNEKYQSPLARARGMGSAGEGVSHWLKERIIAAALIPLTLWFIWTVAHMPSWDHAGVMIFLSNPVNAVLMLLALGGSLYHGALGVQVIVEDYVHNEALRFITLMVLNLLFLAVSVACIFSLLKIAL